MRALRRLQAIDIGTNSVRSIVVEVADDGTYRGIDDEKETARLGDGLDATGSLSQEAMDRTIAALGSMLEIGRTLGVGEIRAIGTEAVRRAANRNAFIERVRRELGIAVEVVSAADEGRLVFLSAAANIRMEGAAVVVDIGGGSVEIVQAMDGEPNSIVSLPLGARVLTERFVDGDPPSAEAFRSLKRYVRRLLRERVALAIGSVPSIVASGGTATSVAAIVAARRGRHLDSLQGFEMTRPEVMKLLSQLAEATADARHRIPGMPADRIDIILAGTLVLAEIMRLFGASDVVLNARGIREGIVIDTVRAPSESPRGRDRMRSVAEFGEHCRFERTHAEQVTRLSLSLFDQLVGPLRLAKRGRPLLEAAAMLHDVGYFISYEGHHKHSYHLILRSGLPGFTQRELAAVAALARYHTKAMPRPGHDSWVTLDSRDRRMVEQMAALLRLADGLDRGRASLVSEVVATVGKEAIELTLEGSGDLRAELYGAEKKKDLLEKVSALPVSVRAARHPDRETPAAADR